MTRKTGPVELLARAKWLEEKVNALPVVTGTIQTSWTESRDRHRAAVTELLAEFDQAIPPISTRNDGGTFVFASMGIRTSSTMGMVAAARHWIRFARQKAQDLDRTL